MNRRTNEPDCFRSEQPRKKVLHLLFLKVSPCEGGCSGDTMTGIKQSAHDWQTGLEICYACMPCSGEAEFDRSGWRKGVCAQPAPLSVFFKGKSIPGLCHLIRSHEYILKHLEF